MDNKAVYQEIAVRILSTVPETQTVELFHDQLENANEDGLPIASETVLLEFGNTDAEELSNRQYAIRVPLTVHTCVADLTKTSLQRRQGESAFTSQGFKVLDRSAAIKQAILARWTTGTVKEINFLGSNPPSKSGGLDVIASRFQVLYYE